MADRLFIRLCSGHPQRRALLELVCVRACSGRLLAGALGGHWPDARWFWGPVPLSEVHLLPVSGEIFLCDMPMGGPPDGSKGGRPGWPIDGPPDGQSDGRTDGRTERGVRRATAALVVVEGPDPGGALPLLRGAYSLGRGDVDFRIDDPRLSRLHAVLRVSETSIGISDEGSANGLWFAGARIRERRLLLGERFTAGGSTLAVLATQARETGRGPWPLRPVAIEGREPPSHPGTVLLGAFTPLVLGAGLYLMTGRAFFLLFSTLSLLTGGLPAFFMLRARRAYRRAAGLARTRDAARREELAAPIGSVAAGLCRAVTTGADGFPPMVPGHAVQRAWIRAASGADPGAASGASSGADPGAALGAASGAASAAGALASRGEPARRSPVLVAMYDGLLLALEGSDSRRGGLLRAVLVRWLPLLHSGALRVFLVGPAEFLPAEFLMLRGVEVCEVGSGGAGQFTAAVPVPTVVLVAPGEEYGPAGSATPGNTAPPKPEPRPGSASAPGGKYGAPVAWVYCGGTPKQVRAQVTLDGSGLLLLDEAALAHSPWLGAAATSEGLRIEPAALGFETLARAVRRVLSTGSGDRPRPPATGLTPGAVPLPPGPPRRALDTVVGDADGGPLPLDLLRHGPHLLVAGTTGSGKSELLRTLVLGLARGHGPHELAFMLVDFKGGATLAPLAGLPHVQNLVSDLDAAGARRVLEQLSCELLRRERLLAAHHATDIASYRESRTDADPLLPALVVVVDEFRVFATELPGALERIVQVATVGRSLGIHLVLSTQRPAGTLNAQLRANISSVIALRTTGEFESTDLIGTDAAAHLEPGEPGWAFLRFGGEAPLKFRVHINASAGTGASLRAWGRSLRTPLWRQELGGPAVNGRQPDEQGPVEQPCPQAPGTGTAKAVEQIRRVWSGQERAASPFSPALPEVLAQLPRAAMQSVPSDGAVAIGLVDRVESARPAAMLFDIRSCGGLAVCGLPGSGAETVPALLVRALNRLAWTAPCFVLDGNGAQRELAGHPGVGGYFGPQDSWRIQELLLQLADAAPTDPLVLVVSGLGGWAQALGPGAQALLEAALGAFARTAQTPGRALVLCGDRELAGSRIASLCETRWYFPRGAGPEVLMGWPKLKQVGPFPGRGLLVGPGEPETGTEFQLLDPSAAAGHPRGPVPPGWLRSVPLPELLRPAELDALLPASVSESRRPTGNGLDHRPSALPIGACGPDNRAFKWSPGQFGVVIGHEGSGKSGLFGHLAARGLPGNQTCLRFGLDDALPSHPGQLREGRFADARVGLVLIDRADLRVREAARALEILGEARIQVVFGTEPSARILMELGLGAVVRDQHSFLVLDPRSPADADPSGFRFTPDARSIPGRALVCDNGTLRQIQCANAS
ncbi:FtsK/SpoIIIE domain-containing protein [Paeniglutamicibacter sp. NPDC012692]|uniref:FtsK/SpoIIIE domain-containing protein n=1 Tax=Paeniglutamicibacter sp. NPDC012692 TaxID=3364388 RepID=UPI00367DD716